MENATRARMQAQKILIPVSGYPADAQALEVACHLARPRHGKVHLLYVIEVRRAEPVDADVPQETADVGEAALRNLEDLAGHLKCSIEGDVVQARNAGPAVVQEAVKREVDVIVLPCPYKQRFGTFSLGDTIPYILRHAPCWVLLVREATPAKANTSRW